MSTGHKLSRRMDLLTKNFYSIIKSSYDQVLSDYGKQMRCLLRKEEVKLFMELLKPHINECIKEKRVIADLSGDNSLDRLYTKIYKDPEMFLRYKEFRTLQLIDGVIFDYWSIEEALKIYHDDLFIDVDESINVDN